MKQTQVNYSTIKETIVDDVKQAIIDIQAGEEDCFMKFLNNGMVGYSIACSGGYSIIYDCTNDRLVVAWLLKVRGSNIHDCIDGSWGQGYYFDNNGGSYLNERYDIDRVVDLFVRKALGIRD